MPKRKTRFSKDANYWQRLNSVIRNESSPSMPGIVPACQGKLTELSSIKTGISALGNDSTIQGLQRFFFQSIAAKHTDLNEQQRFFCLHIHVSTFGGKSLRKRQFCSAMTCSTGPTLDLKLQDLTGKIRLWFKHAPENLGSIFSSAINIL